MISVIRCDIVAFGNSNLISCFNDPLKFFSPVEAQSQLTAAVEKERFASEKLLDATGRLSSLETQVSSLRQEKSRLMAELDVERAKLDVAEEARNKFVTWLNVS